MAGYTRQSSFVDGDTITAALFNDEYNQLVNVFSNTSGHKHDGTAAEGPVIGLIGDAGETSPNNKVLIDTTNNYIEFYVEVSSAPVQQLYIADGAIVPVTDSDIDLGTTSLRFKDTYTDTVTTTGNVTVGGNLTVTGNATISGNLTFGDADTDSINLAAEIDSDIIPNTDGTYDLGSATKEWQDLYIDGTANIDSLVADTADINAGTIDNTVIGGTTAVAGTFTTATATTGNITTVNATTVDTTNIEVTNLKAKDGTSAGSIADTTGVVTLASSVLTTTDINGGTIDGVTIGGTSAGAVTFTDLSDGTITITAFVDEDNMASNSATLVPTQQSVKAYVDAQVTAQDLDFQGDTGGALSIDLDSETLTIAGGTGIDTVGATNTLTVSIDSTVATLTGTQTLTNKTLTTPVISSIVNTGTLTLPTSTDTLVGRATTDTLTNKTLTSPVINTGVSGTAVLDDDTFATASATTLATSESIKAYVDTQITAEDLDVSDGATSIAIDLDSETLGILGGTGLTSSASGNNVTLSVDASQTQITAVGTLTDLTVTGEITANGGIALGDSDIATFGASDDLQIYHDGSNSYLVDSGTGDFYIQATNLILRSNGTTENYLRGLQNGAVQLYYDGSITLATTSTGIDVTGTVVADGLDIDGDTTLEGTTSTDATTAATAVSEAILRVKPHSDTGNSLWFSLANSADPVLQSSNFDGTTLNDILLNPFGGNVGIGTTSPAALLHVESTGTPTIRVRDADGTNTYGDFYHDGGGTYITARAGASDGNIRLGGAGGGTFTEFVRIDGAGKVGIGTTSPTEELTIKATDPRISLEDSNSVATGANGLIEFDGTDTRLGYMGAVSGDLHIFTDSGTNGEIIFSTNNSEAARIDSSGDVGIGGDTTTATTLNNLSIGAYADSSSGIVLRGTTASALNFEDNSSVTAARVYYNHASGYMAFNTEQTERMRIDSSGNLMVGKTVVSVGSDGSELRSNGIMAVSRTDANPFYVNRNGTDGTLVEFRKNNVGFGAITAVGSGKIGFHSVSGNGLTVDSSGNVGVNTTSPNTGITVATSANISQVAITSSSGSVAWNATSAANAYYATTENTTFAAPTNAVEGAIISVEIAQGATAYTVAWNTVFEFAASTAPTVTATANKTDIFSFRYNGSVWQEIGRTQNLAQT